jgi:hypothetical protein
MTTDRILTSVILTIAGLLLGLLIATMVLKPGNSQDKAYYIEIRGESIYIMDGLGHPQAKVGEISQHPDPEALEEVLETQVGWGSVLKASEAYYLILED